MTIENADNHEEFPATSPATGLLNNSQADEEIQECRCRCCGKVNKELLPSKLFYFFFFAANGSLMPYLILFFKQLQLSPSQVGVVSGLKPFISFLFSPIWGYIADRSRCGRIIYVISLFAYIGGYVAYSLTPHSDPCKLQTNMSVTKHHPYMFHMHKRETLEFSTPTIYTLFSSSKRSQLLNKTRSDDVDAKPKRLLQNNLKSKNNTSYAIPSVSFMFTDISSGLMGETLFHMPSSAFVSDSLIDYIPETMDPNDNIQETDIDDQVNANLSKKTWSGAVHSSNFPWTVCAAAKANIRDLNTGINMAQSNTNDTYDIQRTYYYLLIVTLIATIFSCPLITLVDAATIRQLKENDNTHKYGNQRMWGSFGYGIFAFVVGAILSALLLCPGINKEVNYYPAFYIFAAFQVCALIAGFKLRFNDTQTEDGSMVSRTKRIQAGLELMKDPSYFSFIITSFYIGVTMSIIKTFLFWHLKDIGGTQLLFSIIAAVNCVAEVSVYYFASILIKRLSHIGVLYVALLCYSLRLFYYGLLTNPWYVLAAEPLSGITTAAAWAAMTSYIGLNAPKDSGTTMQGIFFINYYCKDFSKF